MMKRLAIVMALMVASMSASAQVATPRLDRLMKVQSPAAAGWRDGTTLGLQSASAEGKYESNGTEVGDVKIGAAAEASLPALIAAYKGEALGAELYYNAGTAKQVDVSSAVAAGVPNYETDVDQLLSETRLNLAYVFGDSLSIGLGYRVNETKDETAIKGTIGTNPLTGMPVIYSSWVTVKDQTETETGLGVSASLKLGEIFFIALGVENVEAQIKSDIGSDSAKNSWQQNTLGVGLLVGKEKESRFRAEYAMTQSPESIKDATTTETGHSHYKTDVANLSVEALFGSFILGYNSETKKVDNNDGKTVTSMVGLGWMPEEGFAVSVYSWSIEQTDTDTSTKPTGWRLNFGWNF